MSDTPNTTAIEAEAEGAETVTVEWRDLSFDVPRDRADWTLDAELAARADDPIAFVQAMISGDDFYRLREMKLRNREVAELGSLIVEALGFKSTGESTASSD